MLAHIFDGVLPELAPPILDHVSGVGSGSVRGTIELPFFVDGKVGSDEVYVELKTTFHIMDNFGPGFCVGLDVIVTYGMDLLISRDIATLPAQSGVTMEIPIRCTHRSPPKYSSPPERSAAAWAAVFESSKPPSERKVVLSAAKDVCIPPNSHVFIPVNELPGGRTIDWIAAPRWTEKPQLRLVGSSQWALIRPANTGKRGKGLCFTNLSNVPFHVPKGLPLVDASPVPSAEARKTGEVFTLHDPALEPTVGVESEPQAGPRRGRAFDPNDVEEEVTAEMKARVDAEHPSRTVHGCHVALDENGEPHADIAELLSEFKEAFSLDGKPGRVKVTQVHIPLKDEHVR